MSGKHIGYRRVSTVDQNTARQLDGVNLDKVFEDKASGKDTKRPQLAACLDYLRDGDTLHVHSMDRLARNLDDLRKMVKDLTARDVIVQFHKEGLTFTADSANPMAELMLNLLGAVAQFERSLILERQREGIALAKAAGKYKGRAPSLKQEQIAEALAQVELKIPKTQVARNFGISRETLYRYLAAGQPAPAAPDAAPAQAHS